jgi:hypothetical protein
MISPCAACIEQIGCGNQRACALRGELSKRPKFFRAACSPTTGASPARAPVNPTEPHQRTKNQEEDDDFLGIPNPPSRAANGCLEAVFCGAAEAAAASSILRTEEGDGS